MGAGSDRRLPEGDPGDLVVFNRWLLVSRLRAVIAIPLIIATMEVLGVGGMRFWPIVIICGVLAAFSFAVLRFGLQRVPPRALFYGQVGVDLVGTSLGIGLSVGGLTALLLRSVFLLVIVPSSLVSVRAGLVVTTGASIAHFLLLGFDLGFSADSFLTLGGVVPVALFFLVAQQSFFYAEHLREKNSRLTQLAARLGDSQRHMGGLVRVARTLNSTLDSGQLMEKVNEAALTELGADWAGTFLVDVDSKTFAVAAASEAASSVRSVQDTRLPLAAWPVLERLGSESAFIMRDDEIQTASFLDDGRVVTRFLLAGLYRDDRMIGFLAVAYCNGGEERAEAAFGRLPAIAEHATIALRNAQLLDEAREASRLKSDFVSTMSHELRTPLNVIIGYAEMLRNGAVGALSSDQLDLFEQIDLQARDLYELIEATLQVGRMETGGDELNKRMVPLDEVVGSLRSATAQLPRRDEVAFEWDVRADPSMLVYSDVAKLNLIVRNLVSNAFKFTKRGRVGVSVREDGGNLVVEVSDTGIGMPEESLSRIFEMFHQLDSAPTREHGGVGLGLYIVKQLVDRLGGRVEVESAPGEGTVFRVTIPTEESVGEAAERGAA